MDGLLGEKSPAGAILAAIKACRDSRDLQSGREIHRDVGKRLTPAIATSLIDMYAKCGSALEARSVFDSIRQGDRDVACWNSIIGGMAITGRGDAALEYFDRFVRDSSCCPDYVTFLAAIKACWSSTDRSRGRGMDLDRLLARMKVIHARAARSGEEGKEFLTSALIDSYARSGRMLDARLVFEGMAYRNVVAYTGLMMGFVQAGEGELALSLYLAMQDEGWEPDRVAVLAALKACAMLGDVWSDGGRNCASTKVAKGKHKERTWKTSSEQLSETSVFHGVEYHIGTPDEQGSRTIGEKELRVRIGGADHFKKWEETVKLGTSEDSSRKNYLKSGKRIHCQAVKRGYEEELFVRNTLVDMYSKCGSMEDARRVFEAMQKPSVVSWSSLILGHARCGQGELGLDLYSRMQAEGYVPNAVTYLAALKACVSLAERRNGSGNLVNGAQCTLKRCLDTGRIIHSRADKSGFARDVFVSNALIDMYAKCGSIAEAAQVFNGMKSRDSVSWTSIIQGYTQSGDNKQALQLFARMKGEGYVADAVTFVAALRACASLGALEKGRQIYEELQKAGLDKNTIVWTCLIDFFGKCGSMPEAEKVFLSVPGNHCNLVGWSALIAGYSSQGDTDKVFDLFERMRKQRLQPDDVIFLSILSACSHAGLVEKAKHFIAAMASEHGISPGIQHYSCMVDIYARSNHLDEAVALIRSMPVEPNRVLWTTLLDASQRWNNVEVGQLAFQSLLKLGNICASIYVKMANIYIANNMQDEARRLKALCND